MMMVQWRVRVQDWSRKVRCLRDQRKREGQSDESGGEKKRGKCQKNSAKLLSSNDAFCMCCTQAILKVMSGQPSSPGMHLVSTLVIGPATVKTHPWLPFPIQSYLCSPLQHVWLHWYLTLQVLQATQKCDLNWFSCVSDFLIVHLSLMRWIL